MIVREDNTAILRETFTVELSAGEQEMSRSLPATVQADTVHLRDTASREPARIVLQEVRGGAPEGSAAGPGSARWVLNVPTAGERTFELVHVVRGIGWRGLHRLELLPEGGRAAFRAGVQLVNDTPHEFQAAQVTLARSITGPPVSAPPLRHGLFPEPVTPTAYSESELTPLPAVTSLPAGVSVLLPLADLPSVPVRVVLEADLAAVPPFMGIDSHMAPGMGAGGAQWVAELDNTEKNGLGMALPAGTVQVHRISGEGTLLWGSGSADHTPPGGVFRVLVSPEAGITVEKGLKPPRPDQSGHTTVLKVRSTLKAPHELRLYDRPARRGPDSPATVQDASDLYKLLDDGRVEFRVAVTPLMEREITYTTQ